MLEHHDASPAGTGASEKNETRGLAGGAGFKEEKGQGFGGNCETSRTGLQTPNVEVDAAADTVAALRRQGFTVDALDGGGWLVSRGDYFDVHVTPEDLRHFAKSRGLL